MRRPYCVCGGLQDNNAWCGPSALRSTTGAVNTDWFTVAGGDGFYTRQDPTDWAIVYAESQDGNIVRHDMRNGTQKSIRPNAAAAAAGGGRQQRVRPPARPPDATPPSRPRRTLRARRPRDRRSGRGGGRGGAPNVINAPPNARDLALLLERALRDLAAQSGGGLHGRAVLLQIQQPRRYLVDEPDRSLEEHQPLVAGLPIMGRRRRQAHGGEARRLLDQFHWPPRSASLPRAPA